MQNLTKLRDVLDLLATSKCADEWNTNCAKIKAANGGDFPEWWGAAVIATNFYRLVERTWEVESVEKA